MQKRSIVRRIVASACGIVSLLLIVGNLILIRFEISREKIFTAEYVEKVSQSIQARAQEEKRILEKNVRFNVGILGRITAKYLFDYDMEELKNLLPPYLSYPEIVALEVLDDEDTPVVSIWKAPDITQAKALPPELDLKANQTFQVECVMQEEKVGLLRIFYTDAGIREKIEDIRQRTLKEADAFRQHSHAYLHKSIAGQIVGVLFILLALTSWLIFFWRRQVLRPLLVVSDVAHRLAELDLTVTMETNREDEIGRMLSALNRMLSEFKKIVSDVKSKGERLVIASGQMTDNIHRIASTAEGMSLNVQRVSGTTEQMSQNANAVASSIEEMSASVNEVGKNAHQEAGVAKNAVAMAGKAGEIMASLGSAANEIGHVTEMIKKLADRTTLLALNAHIEAASAGDAGRGFAVVANEIKAFARQSTHAAEDIAGRISFMQENAALAVTAIGDVAHIINTINRSSDGISSALEQQMQAAHEIAANASQANTRASDISASMEELAKGAGEVSRSVGRVAGGKGDDTEDADVHYMDASATEVAMLANELLELMEKFNTEERKI